MVLSGEVLPARTALPARAAAPALRDFRDHPMHAAELLALTAVARYGPQAANSLNWLRGAYPNASAEGLSRVVATRFVRQARTRGAVAGLAGPLAVFIDAGALHALHAELILNIAAAHGLDPTAPERAAELLVLQGVHDSADEARTAVGAAIEPATATAAKPGPGPAEPGGDPTRLTRPLARSLGLGVLRVGARRVLRMVPGAGALIGAVANARATEEVAARAVRFYRSRVRSAP